MKHITLDDIENLAIGTAILGSGGGGKPYNRAVHARKHIREYGPIPLISLETVKNDDFFIPMSALGAPLVGIEKLAQGDEFITLFHAASDYFGKKPTALVTHEIGGANGIVPFTIAGTLGIPVLDADCMGRAFPLAHMNSCELFGINPDPSFICDQNHTSLILHCENGKELERIGREITTSFGSGARLMAYALNGKEAKKALVPNTITQALLFGKTITQAQKNNENPLEKLLEISGGSLLGSGTINDVFHTVSGSFMKGHVVITEHDGKNLEILFQNENLIAKKDHSILATTPDIITLFDSETGFPITNESLRFGQRVHALALPIHDLWKSEKALKLIGPRAFGYTFDYTPFT